MAIDVITTDDPAWVLADARTFLVGEPVLHNLILTLLWARVVAPEPGRYWVVRDERAGQVVGVGFQSPIDFTVTTTPMSDLAVDAVVAALAAAGGVVPGVQAEAATAARIAGQWTEATGSAAVPEMGMRIYALAELLPPIGVPGELRTASDADTAVVLAMIDGFHRDTGEPGVAARGVHEARIASGAYSLWWVDGEPRGLCGRTPPLEGVSRVYAVFTPPEWRGRGYAAAAVAALSEGIRSAGAEAMLYTDLGNPTSNGVYRRIGYRAVAENLRYRFS